MDTDYEKLMDLLYVQRKLRDIGMVLGQLDCLIDDVVKYAEAKNNVRLAWDKAHGKNYFARHEYEVKRHD